MSTPRALGRRSWPALVAIGGGCVVVALSGCAGPPPAARSAGGGVAAVAPASTGSGSSVAPVAAPAPVPVGGACPRGTTAATIGHAATCLAPGQACAKASRGEYPAFGYLCLPNGKQYVLQKK